MFTKKSIYNTFWRCSTRVKRISHSGNKELDAARGSAESTWSSGVLPTIIL